MATLLHAVGRIALTPIVIPVSWRVLARAALWRTARLLAGPVLAFATIGLMWLAGEGLFRVLPPYNRGIILDSDPCWWNWHRANSTFLFAGGLYQPRLETVPVHWNSRGWHDVEHWTPGDKPRVLILGDSYVEAIQVNFEDTFVHRLGQAMNVETVALGRSGWGQVQEADALKGEGVSYGPALLLAEFLPVNDIRNNSAELERITGEESLHRNAARDCYIGAERRGLYFTAFLCDKADPVLARLSGAPEFLDAEVYRESPRRLPNLWAAAWRTTEAKVAEMQTVAHASGATLAIVSFTGLRELAALGGDAATPEGLDYTLPARRMAGICAKLGIPFLDLMPRFLALPKEQRATMHLASDGHWSAEGHAQAAREIAAFIERERLLP